jgi:uncharacterized membrane protein YedE/YeeE
MLITYLTYALFFVGGMIVAFTYSLWLLAAEDAISPLDNDRYLELPIAHDPTTQQDPTSMQPGWDHRAR